MRNNAKVRDLQGRLNNLVGENRSLLAETVEAGTEMSTEQWNTYNAKDEEITRLDEQLQAVQAHYDREDRLAEPADDAEPPVITPGQPDPELVSRAYDKALVPKPDRNERTELTAEERAVLQTDDLAGGGYNVVPEQFMRQLLQKIDDTTYIRGLSTTQTVTQAVSLGVPTLETKESDADWQGEVASTSRSQTWVLGKRELYPRLSAKLVRSSRNYIRNAATPVAEFVRAEFARLFGETEENAFLTGSGAGRPLGVFTASASGISTGRDVSTGNTTTTIGADNLIEVAYSLKEGYFNRATWIGHRDWVKRVRLLKDGNGDYLWQAGIAGNRPNAIIDRPYRMSEFAPNTFTTGLYVAILGDFSYYWIATALSMELQVLNELYAASNEVGWIGRMEVDAMPIFEEAFARSALA